MDRPFESSLNQLKENRLDLQRCKQIKGGKGNSKDNIIAIDIISP